MVCTNRNERTTSKRTPQFSVGIFCQMVSTLGLGKVGWGGEVHFKNSCRQGGVQFSYEIILGGYSFHTPHFSENWDAGT